MKSKTLVWGLLWLMLISALHIQVNVGWESFTRGLLGGPREELRVGFLPVT